MEVPSSSRGTRTELKRAAVHLLLMGNGADQLVSASLDEQEVDWSCLLDCKARTCAPLLRLLAVISAASMWTALLSASMNEEVSIGGSDAWKAAVLLDCVSLRHVPQESTPQ